MNNRELANLQKSLKVKLIFLPKFYDDYIIINNKIEKDELYDNLNILIDFINKNKNKYKNINKNIFLNKEKYDLTLLTNRILLLKDLNNTEKNEINLQLLLSYVENTKLYLDFNFFNILFKKLKYYTDNFLINLFSLLNDLDKNLYFKLFLYMKNDDKIFFKLYFLIQNPDLNIYLNNKNKFKRIIHYKNFFNLLNNETKLLILLN